tara:strand:+ start:1255 stop:1425 length:171 start_codon:yes stop_codon:yes gene_type:complete
MKLKFKRTCSVKGAVVEAGASIDVDEETAHSLIAMGRAEKHSGGSSEKKHKPKAKS